MWLQRGSTGDQVTQVQQYLRDNGWAVAVDGLYGPITEVTVKRVQGDSLGRHYPTGSGRRQESTSCCGTAMEESPGDRGTTVNDEIELISDSDVVAAISKANAVERLAA